MYREVDGHGHTDTHTVGEALHPCMNTRTFPHRPHGEVYSDTTWSIPWCAAVSASISGEGPSSAVGAPLCGLGDDGTEGGAEESGAACVKVGHTVYVEWSSVSFTCMHCECRTCC